MCSPKAGWSLRLDLVRPNATTTSWALRSRSAGGDLMRRSQRCERCSREGLVRRGRTSTAYPRMLNFGRLLNTSAEYLFGSAAGARMPDCDESRVPETAGLL